MKLYLNDKEKSIAFLNLLDIMLNKVLKSGEVNFTSLESILQIEKYDDPVMDFIKYYINDANKVDEFPDGRIIWIKNALYSAKGAPEVIEIVKESFGLDIDYIYDVPLLDIKQIKRLEVMNVQLFCDKFKTLLYYLMYFGEFELAIKELIIRFTEELSQTNYASVKGFINLTSNLENDIISTD